jgi:hypothetical protein
MQSLSKPGFCLGGGECISQSQDLLMVGRGRCALCREDYSRARYGFGMFRVLGFGRTVALSRGYVVSNFPHPHVAPVRYCAMSII